jgi:hypothetical protein
VHKDTYNRRKAQGLCPLCGDIPKEGRTRCERCLALSNENASKQRARLVATKRCVQCNQANPRGGWLCETCSKKETQRASSLVNRRRENGLCVHCENPSAAGSKRCIEHRKRKSETAERLRQYRIKNRQCTSCGAFLPDGWTTITCAKCIERGRIKTERKRRTIFEWYGGKCMCCGEDQYYFLSLDHVESDGGEERRRLGGQYKILSRLWKEQQSDPRYQLLCYNCNFAREMCGICPHQWPNPLDRPIAARRRSSIVARIGNESRSLRRS